MKNKIKILYALESAGGGTLKHVNYLAGHLNPELFEITVILPGKRYEQDTEAILEKMVSKGICIDIIPMSKSITLKDIYTIYCIYNYLKKRSFDIIHAHSSKAGAIFRISAWLIHFPVIIYTPHCFYFNAKTGWLHTLYSLSERILARITDAIILSCPESVAIQEQKIISLQKIAIIDNAIDTKEYKRYSRTDIRHKLQIPDHYTVVIGVGRLVKQKNWELFIDVSRDILSRHTNYHFIIAGEGPLHQLLADRIEKYGLTAHIQLTGYIADISLIYSVADVFVSTSRWEGLPYTYLEASYFNLPMVITPTTGIKEFCKYTTGVHLTISTIAHISKTITNISLHPNKDKICSFSSITSFIKQHEKLYIRLFSQKNSKKSSK